MPAAGESILFVGDLHGLYDEEDTRFLSDADAALRVFVGDLGDEDPEIVERICELDVPFVVMLGNHDAWASFRKGSPTDELARSIELLGDRHLAYKHLDLDAAEVTLVGARPFSWGGLSLRSQSLYEGLYGIKDHESSAAKIVETANAGKYRDLVIVAHNGPAGLGDQPTDIYGKDFGRPGGDWGDIDLRLAITTLRTQGYRIRLCVAGHMHHKLVHPRGEFRKRWILRGSTVHVNAARVPRIYTAHSGRVTRHYVEARLAEGKLLDVHELYASESRVKRVKLWAAEESTSAQSSHGRQAQ